MQNICVGFLLKWRPCFWLKVFRVIKWHTAPDGRPERRLCEETGALWLLCLLLHALMHFLMMVTASIPFTQSCTQDLFYLFKEGVTMTHTRCFHTKCSTGINISPALVFIFLNQMNHQYVNIIMVSNCTNAQSLVQHTEHIQLMHYCSLY